MRALDITVDGIFSAQPIADKIMLRKRFVIETVLDTSSPKWAWSIHATGPS